MAGNAREFEAGPETKLGERVAVADAAGVDADADLAGSRIGELLFNEFEGSAGGGDLHGAASD